MENVVAEAIADFHCEMTGKRKPLKAKAYTDRNRKRSILKKFLRWVL
jgi:hypothetical protein